MNRYIAILLFAITTLSGINVFAINTSEDIDQTILDLYKELQYNQQQTDEEIDMLQESQNQYWDRIIDLQKEIDKAALVLYAQDGGSLFSVGLASESLSNVCNRFNREKVPFENWFQIMTQLSNRYANIRKALEQIHTEYLEPITLEYIDKSISICDSLDVRFGILRDSISLDKLRYENLSAEIHNLEKVNREAINQIRAQIFQNNDEDIISFFSSFNYSTIDLYYDNNTKSTETAFNEYNLENRIEKWEDSLVQIALILSIVFGIILRFILPKENSYRNKRWYFALLLYITLLIIGSYIMKWTLNLNNYMIHIEDIFLSLYYLMFWMVLSATIRLKRPGIGWSIAAYMPLFFLGFILIYTAIGFTRSMSLKFIMPIVFLFTSLWALTTIAIGAKRFLKTDYLSIFSCMGLIFVSTALMMLGYFYLSFILVLFGMSVMTYLFALVCFKRFFAKRIERAGSILHLTLSHLIYPIFNIYVILQSLNNVANVFNLRTWLSELIATPFVSIPQFGIISASRIISLILIGILVNYIIKLIKLILIRIDKEKYETGTHAVTITLCTMLIWFGYGILSLLVLQINHSGVIAAIGGASIGISFALKETFESLISGLQLMASRARPGDLVICDGQRGVIRRIGILSTQIQVDDGPIVSFSNRQLLGSTFTNLTLNNRREIRHIIFDISADNDLQLAKELMIEAARDIVGVVDHDKHYVAMRNSNSGIVRLDYKCWIDSAQYLRAEPAVREAIFCAFRTNGIKIADFSNELGMHLTGTVVNK